MMCGWKSRQIVFTIKVDLYVDHDLLNTFCIQIQIYLVGHVRTNVSSQI